MQIHRRKAFGANRRGARSRGMLGLGLALLALGAAPVDAQVVTEYGTGITGFAQPFGITAGPVADGNLWFTEFQTSRIGRINPTTHVISEFSTGITGVVNPQGIALGSDGNLWFTESIVTRIGRIDPATQVITEFSTGISADPSFIAAGADGNLWFTEIGGNRIGQITPAGVVTEFQTGLTGFTGPLGITAGPDGNLWFTESLTGRIGQITTTGVITEFSTGITAGSDPFAITAGPDGNLWFTEQTANQIGRIDPTTHVITEFSAGISPSAGLDGITAGPDGNLWFTEFSTNKIGRITTAGVVTEYSVTGGSSPTIITSGPDGALWFTEHDGNRIGRITTVGPPSLQAAASRKVHGASGMFDLSLSLVPTNPTTEPRQGPAQTIVFIFDKPITAATAAITEGTATAGVPTFSGNDVIVDLTGVNDVQYVTVSLTNVTSSDGGTGGVGAARVGFLKGDVNASRLVAVTDLVVVNNQLGRPLTLANFVSDVNASGIITVLDKVVVNNALGHFLPAP